MYDLIKRLLVPRNIGHEKIRIGPMGDGGYVLSKQCLDNHTKAVYSLGIGDNCDFDYELAERGLPIYQFDGSISETPRTHANFNFSPIFVQSHTIPLELETNSHFTTECNLLLKMDIEGGEYQVFPNLSWQYLDCFSQITFELHGCVFMTEQVLNILSKLSQQFVLIHLHANNTDNRVIDEVPNVLELTYVNNRIALPAYGASPDSTLDVANANYNEEHHLKWWVNRY